MSNISSKKIKKYVIVSLILLMFTLLVACKKDTETIKIAEQYGLAYAPIQIMKESGYLEEILGEDIQIEWVKLANTAAIREAMLGDDLDVGFMGIPPFLIGVDNQMDWKIMTGLSKSPLGLVTNDQEIHDLEDLVDNGKIALPQPGSIQHILLSMAAKNQLGKADVFDKQLVSMKHPDGLMALMSKTDINSHFTSPPYIFKELEAEDNHLLVSGQEAFGGEFTFIVGVCREEFYENKEAYEKLNQGLLKAIELINNKDQDTLTLLANSYELDMDTLKSYLYHDEMKYEQTIEGVQVFSDFMYEVNYISQSYKEKDVIWNERD